MPIPGLRFLRALKESWDEAQNTSRANRLLDLETDMRIEKKRSTLTRAKTKAILAEAKFHNAKAEIIRAKILQEGGNSDGGTTGHSEKGAGGIRTS